MNILQPDTDHPGAPTQGKPKLDGPTRAAKSQASPPPLPAALPPPDGSPERSAPDSAWRTFTRRLGWGGTPRTQPIEPGQLPLPLPAAAAAAAAAAEPQFDDAIPLTLRKRYLIADNNKYFFRDREQELAFEDLGNRLCTPHDAPEVAVSMVELAQAKGWDRIKISGSTAFKREAWLAAMERGLLTRGHRPSSADRARLADRLTQRKQEMPQHELQAPQREQVNAVATDPSPEKKRKPKRAKSEKRTPQQPQDTPAAPPVSKAQRDAVDGLTRFLRQRGDSEAAIAMTVELAASELAQRRAHFGTLLEHGSARYQHDKDNDRSYFVTLATPQGRETIWGVELKDAIADSGAKEGDGIVLVQQGKIDVTVKAKERDANGRATGKRVMLDTKRNQWEVISLDNARDFATRQAQLAAPSRDAERNVARQR
ncbi:putative DNA primase/helicase [Duganella sp. SG902]|uniref:LPD7 domain-containing protein n=1 Tax=Duganella sp. SG902 TaxID=2587016 RepID=UPI00159E6315|nr:LPD7 domain-containing protein [Duganella sp. SG902]NVM77455.1 putative DNA primase/helicase [Duganella sp. SG902]